MVSKRRIIIDGSGISGGGGLRHIQGLLKFSNPEKHQFESIVIHGSSKLLQQLPDLKWLSKRYHSELDQNIWMRRFWQLHQLPKLLAKDSAHVLLSLNGLSGGLSDVPTAVLCHNLEPLDPSELRRTPTWSRHNLRNRLLRLTLVRSFSRANALISLSKYAQELVHKQLGQIPPKSVVIYHGVDDSFDHSPRVHVPLSQCTHERPFRLLYVSTVFYYKHQWNVALAVNQLRTEGLSVAITFAGGGLKSAKAKLFAVLDRIDRERKFTDYRDEVNTEELLKLYGAADGFVFASTCETFGCVLTEAAKSQLPIASSDHGPMREILNDGALYFDPLSVEDMVKILRNFIKDSELRAKLNHSAYETTKSFSWKKCADETFQLLGQL